MISCQDNFIPGNIEIIITKPTILLNFGDRKTLAHVLGKRCVVIPILIDKQTRKI